MTIYRGEGGSGDSTTDAYASLVAQSAQTATTKANEASASASAASSSASAASTAQTAAELAETNAETAQAAAETAQTAAELAENNAETAENNAASSASAASTSATNASNSASAASTSETNAAASASTATTKASEASTSATNAAASATTATTQATNAASSASAASTSATNAASSATASANSAAASAASETASAASESAAATSESNAATSESNASTSATNASNSASAASTSATNASNSASSASTSATNAASSASAASTSASNASTSETNASNSASAASTSATNASNSATAASSSASAASTSETNAANSATAAAASAADAATTAASIGTLDSLSDVTVTTPSTGQVLKYNGSVWINDTATGGLANVVEDTTPQLGGTLEANGNTINMGTNTITDTKVGQWDTAYSWGNHSVAGYLASSSYTAADVLAKIVTVDGSGSGLDADTVDGLQASQFLRKDTSDTMSGDLQITGSTFGGLSIGEANTNYDGWNKQLNVNGAANARINVKTANVRMGIYAHDSWHSGAAGHVGTYTNHPLSFVINAVQKALLSTTGSLSTTSQGTLWGASNDGSGSGLDADLLDGIQAASFLRSDAGDTFTGNLTTGADNHITFGPNSSWGSSLRIGGNGRTVTGTETASIATTDGNIHLDAAASVNGIYLNFYAGTNGTHFGNGASSTVATMDSTGQLYKSSNPYWHAGNDGSGSGLDADLLDGNQATAFATAAQGTLATNALPKAGGTLTGNLNLSGSTNHIIIGGTASNNAYNSVSSTTGLTFGGGNDFANYSIGTSLQNIGGNYTKLNIKWHTGIRFFANPTYGGVRFHSDAVMSTELMSIGNTDGNVRVANNLYANGGGLVWNANNDGAGSGLDADLLDGAQPSVSASNNTIVQRHSSGYIFANYFNTTPDDVSSGITKVCVEIGNDGYIRHGTPDGVALFLDGVSGGSVTTARNNGAVNYVYNVASATPTRGSCGTHIYQQWGNNLVLNLTSSTWQQGDVVVVKNVRGAVNITVNAPVIYLPTGSYDNSVTFNGTVGSFTLIKYNTTTGHWMVGP